MTHEEFLKEWRDLREWIEGPLADRIVDLEGRVRAYRAATILLGVVSLVLSWIIILMEG